MTDEISPDITEDMKVAKDRVKKATVAAVIQGGIIALFGIASFFFTETEGKSGIIFEAFLILTIAFFMHRQSFTACIIMVLYWAVSVLFWSIILGKGGIGAWGLLLSYYYINGVRGAWILRKQNPPPKWSTKKRILVWGTSLVVGPLLLLLIVLGTMMETNAIPNSMVVEGNKLPDEHVSELRSIGTLQPDEQVELFYSGGILSYMEDGNMLTDRHVISYWIDENAQFQQEIAPYEDVVSADISSEGSTFEDAVIQVNLKNGDYIQLIVSTEDGGDQRILRSLQNRLSREEN